MAVYTGPMATFRKGKPIMADFDAGVSTYNAGDVIVVGAVPVIAHESMPAFTGGLTRDAVAVGGGIYEFASDGTPIVGEPVFWDATNKKAVIASNGVNTELGICVAGPTFLTSGASPTTDLDLIWVLHRPGGGATNKSGAGASEATASATAALTAAQVLGGFINSVPVAGITLTLPTAALLVAAMIGCRVGDYVNLSLENSSAGANAITLAAGTGGTLRGGTSVAQNKSALLRILLTNVTPASEAYTVHSIIGA